MFLRGFEMDEPDWLYKLVTVNTEMNRKLVFSYGGWERTPYFLFVMDLFFITRALDLVTRALDLVTRAPD
jgi:hypothetical protein